MRRALPILTLVALAALAALAAVAQGVPADVVDAVPGGETSMVGMLTLAVGYLGRLILSRPSPDAHRRALDEIDAQRTEIRELRDRLLSAEVRAATGAAAVIPPS